ncbi:hypothetical protein Vadar_018278 [Vaccinium darrowii]|uniref:Uncharacterized protein n=1 Tax=Vaccinium darrowii TaxID=229202 RepID=A0ACB7XJ36_9ERIC|nr:hypothetical protein Vadar_018278 [Vaccinium darrowii]
MASKTLSSFLLLITTTTLTIHSQSKTQDSDSDYNDCKPFVCGNLTFPFPFSSSETFGSSRFGCGLPRFKIACDASSVPRLELSGLLYQVKSLFLSDRLITVVNDQLINDLASSSCKSISNLTIPIGNDTAGAGLALPSFAANLTVFKCPNGLSLSSESLEGVFGNYSCREEGVVVYFRDQIQRESRLVPVKVPIKCKYVTVPISAAGRPLLFKNTTDTTSEHNITVLEDWLRDGFPLQWPDFKECTGCQNTSGRCGYDGSSRGIVCLCKGLQPNFDARGGCLHKPKKSNKWKVISGAAAGSLFVLLVVALLVWFKYKHRISSIFKQAYDRENQMTGTETNAKEFVKNYQSTLVSNYSYKDIKKMTSGFKAKLGEGGYGTVYKGRLPDGRLIAVKLLENYKGNNRNFLNEVNTIGVANGIEYLHDGCDLRILHLDIKPQNVLLDQNFNPKISDFGLAKVYSRNRSAVTMTGARGTIGYIAPEIFLRHLGNPSNKSDVYSFGMLLLEMVGVNKRVEAKPDTNTSSSESYFPSWVYDKLIEEKERELELGDSVVGEEVHIARKMVMVGLWCIQMNPKDRPSMKRVVEMLCGDTDAIEMPPKPFVFSPPRLQIEPEITSIDSESSVLPLTSAEEVKKEKKKVEACRRSPPPLLLITSRICLQSSLVDWQLRSVVPEEIA